MGARVDPVAVAVAPRQVVEAIVGESEGAAEDSAEVLWTNGLRNVIVAAAETDQKGQESDSIWRWRPSGPWLYPVTVEDHDGTDGCPQ